MRLVLVLSSVLVFMVWGDEFYVPMPRCPEIEGGRLGGQCQRANCFIPISQNRECLVYTCDTRSDGTGIKGYQYYQVPPHVLVWESKFENGQEKFVDVGDDPHVRNILRGSNEVGGQPCLSVDSTTDYAGGSKAPQWARTFHDAEVEEMGQSEKIRFKVRSNSPACDKFSGNLQFMDYRDRVFMEFKFSNRSLSSSDQWELLVNNAPIRIAAADEWYDIELDVNWDDKNVTNIMVADLGSNPIMADVITAPFPNPGAVPPLRKITMHNFEDCWSYWGNIQIYSKKVPLWEPQY